MSENTLSAAPTGQQANPFNPRTLLALVIVGFLAFLATLYFIAVGDMGQRDNNGAAHAAAHGLNGYSGFVSLLENEGYDVTVSRSPSDLETYDLLVLTPPSYTDAEEFGELLEERQHRGPTLIILPKWSTAGFPRDLPDEVEDDIKKGWIRLVGSQLPQWTQELPEPFALEVKSDAITEKREVGFSGYGITGSLPMSLIHYAENKTTNETMVNDGAGRALAMSVWGEEGSEFYDNGYAVVFATEPDLFNNYGMADADRTRLALEVIKDAGYEDASSIVFDVTLNGLGDQTNLLTLAFQPPFLAATLCLIAMLIVIGWRAFKRFGPPVAQGPAIAFGKQRLVANGAGLIVRAKRFGLLADPYITLSAQRMRDALSLQSRDFEALDQAIERRLPGKPNFTQRANALRNARSQSDILRAAQALKDLERTLKE